MKPTETRYAKNGDIHIAYQTFGGGDIDLVFVPGFISHIENYWEEPGFARWLQRLGSFARVIMFDKQGTGLSDRVSQLPGIDERMDDVRAVMDAEKVEQAAIFGISEGGSLATVFAASHPGRSRALILYGAFAQFKSWFATKEALESLFQYVDSSWGTGESLPWFAPSLENDIAYKQWWGKFERLGASPGAVKTLMHMNSQIDITGILSSVKVPTLIIHRRGDTTVDVEGSRRLAKGIANAKYVELSGIDHIPWVGDNQDQILDEMAQFLTGKWNPAEIDRILATTLFTDIVDSTKHAAAMGDRRWRALLSQHDTMLYKTTNQFRGRVVKSTGDGFLATFDGPARAIRCALTIRNEALRMGIQIRAGLHTGEIELIGEDIGGIAVHIAARVLGKAKGNEVAVSRTVKDLVVGSNFQFHDRGTHHLKGIPGQWHLFAVEE